MCTSFVTLMHLYFHFLFSAIKTNTISCNSDSACKSQTMYCTEGEHCYIECKGSDACNYATFHCPSGAFNCDVLCSGSTNLASSYGCLDMTIDGNATNGGNMTIYGINKPHIMSSLTAYCPSNGDCIISCHDTSACANLNVHCPSDANCIISCHDTNACVGGDFFAHPNARLLSIQCGAHSACDSLYIRCP
eukprot:745116_1